MVQEDLAIHAIHPNASSGTVNVTPLSDASVSLLSSTGSAGDMLESLQAGTKAPTAAKIAEVQGVLNAAIAGVAQAANASGSVFNSKFAADGTGFDKLLDAISVSANSEGAVANIQIAVKTAVSPENPADADKKEPINISSTTTVAQAVVAANAIGSISAADLPTNDLGSLYKDFLKNMNACYKDVPGVRTNGTSTVLSTACKKIFLDNDPTQYLNAGQRLGSTAQFAGMFTYADSVIFLPTAKPYLAQDLAGKKSVDGKGRAIVSYSWINEQGNRENVMAYVTKYTDGGTTLLGLSGDRNSLNWNVSSHNQKREFPLIEDKSLDYVQSGYLIAVRDGSFNNSAITKAKVTSPSGKIIFMTPAAGGASRDLNICKSAEVTKVAGVPTGLANNVTNCTGSKFITFAQAFTSPSEARKPSDMTNAGVIRPLDATGSPYTPTSADLKNYPNVAFWTIEYTFANNQTRTQKTWSIARPMTVEELQNANGPGAVLPSYTKATIDALKALKASQVSNLTACPNPVGTCVAAQSPIPAPSTGGFRFEWSGKAYVPVISLWASGRLNDSTKGHISSTAADNTTTRPSWDDQLNVRSTTKSAVVLCSRQSQTDDLCTGSVAVSGSGGYNGKTWMSYSELWGRDSEQRSVMRSYNWYQPTF